MDSARHHQWIGYWEQHGMGRQPMVDLVLQIEGGNVQGGGRDIVGQFTFAGRMEADGQTELVKQYVGHHAVLYQGQYDGEGTIFGEWSIHDLDRGSFVLRLGGDNRAAERQINAARPGASSPDP